MIREAGGVLLIAVASLLGLSLASYNPGDPSFNSYLSGGAQVKNYAGIMGATVADLAAQAAGSVAWAAPAGLFYIGFSLLFGAGAWSVAVFVSGLALFAFSTSAIIHIHWAEDPLFGGVASGGMLGQVVAERAMAPWFAVYGSYVILSSLFLVSLLLMTRTPVSSAVDGLGRAVSVTPRWAAAAGRMAWRGLLWLARIRIPILMETEEERRVRQKKSRIREKERAGDGTGAGGEVFAPDIVDFAPEEPPPLPPGRLEIGGDKKPSGEPENFQQEIFRFGADRGDYEFPSLKLLDSAPNVSVRRSKDDLLKSSRILEKKLLDFGIEGRVTQVLPGPVITIFEFEPAPGVKVSRIVSLADDLAMSLRAMSVRILAPVPGKPVVGIEVPNVHRESVFLKELLSSEEYQRSDAKIPLTLGRDVTGRPIVEDLSRIPHLLIAGSTGSGKSVGINAMVLSILYRAAPSDVKFIMIDPKMLELSIYDGIPHLIAPVVTNPKKAANALRWVVAEMERRYAVLSELGVRNIESYNRMIRERPDRAARRRPAAGEEDAPEPLPEKLPYIVVVIDELADLMMIASKEVEDALARVAQMARAAGIHLIVATQRPSVDVLTGLIKANFPARISFQVRSRVDSRTIIDSMGAEKLLGKGDMLYLPPGSDLRRIQGPFVSDAEIHRVVKFLKGQSEPVYNEEILKPQAEEAEDALEEDMDEFYDQAVELVARTRQASISMIQRRLRIGYNRAARIVEIMEKQGLVGPADGAKPREVYVRDTGDVESYN
ncbi:MAG: DNA translocase FtsK [Candidatus Nitrospinota bacterium M3_3B_026]